MELLLGIMFIAILFLLASSILGNQRKHIQSNNRIEKKLDKIIELLGKEDDKLERKRTTS